MVQGSVRVDFPQTYQDWTLTDPLDLFQAPIVKNEANPKAHIYRHLNQEARGCGYLVLWLDCDREGENICFEVIECTGFDVNDTRRKVFRARFSSVTEKDILRAMDNLVEPNKDEALSVDARQEIDLKVGVAFTRFQTNYFQGKYGNLDSRVISYGPCQTPTLGFCVQRYLQISTFKPEKFWSLRPYILQSGYELQLEWERQKLFDLDAATMFQNLVMEDGIVEVTDVSEKQEVKSRPPGLNTVNLLKVASSALGLGPQTAMQIAERLYTRGFISYPRTESTAYPSSFDFKGTLGALTNNPTWGNYVRTLLADGYHKPRVGTDAGDHPPITPMLSATEDMLDTDSWRLYEYVCQHFIGTLSPDCKYLRTKVEFSTGGESFHSVGHRVLAKGFTHIMPWLGINEKNLPQFTQGEKIEIATVELYEGSTTPPDYLSESELISLMEKNGIGTDASIPVHINNICERNFVKVQAGRKLVPTALGITLIRGYQCIDPDLCLPDIRSFIEQQINLVAKGQADHTRVVQHVLLQFRQKFSYFVKQIDNMDALFEAQFSPVADSGRALSKCGKCLRYMKYISSLPSRLYCTTCEEVYYLPQKGAIKLYKELTCPLDNFELLICSMPGPEGKSFPLCPYCYNSPPFEGITMLFGAAKIGGSTKLGKGAGMPCFLCPHPTCQHSMIAQGVCACPECSGTLVLDPISAPKWRLHCNTCNCLVFLPQGAHRISTTRDKCPDCNSTIIEVDFNKKTTPLEDGSTLYTGCILCDEFLHSLLEMKHGKSFFRRLSSRGRGRGAGRGGHRGRGRGAGKYVDPKMSFRDF
ncbi:DNA topoisomerase, type IA [Trema orientale]|uniref:DNA topoisomerase n=1 Tax=Trema orientale TaxID=63057 RepID=A0A2P5FCM3_TREOI|nr:DNA topoisomerase, type IA [Trema orientale]